MSVQEVIEIAALRGRTLKSVDYRAAPQEVLEAVHEQLRCFGLAIEQFHTGTDEYLWEVVSLKDSEGEGV